MKRRLILSAIALAAAAPALLAAKAQLPPLHVFKSPSCGCCGDWVNHMEAAGFPVQVTEVDDTTAARKRLGMPNSFGACHTATVAGYVIEGHVPADEVKRLLALKPQAAGLAVPSMPPGSPGMEVEGRLDPYQVLLIDRTGRPSVFATYPK